MLQWGKSQKTRYSFHIVEVKNSKNTFGICNINVLLEFYLFLFFHICIKINVCFALNLIGNIVSYFMK